MLRHLYAYLIILAIYYIPAIFLSPSGWLYFVSIAAWSWISIALYLRFIRLRCATILCAVELIISICAIIALCEYRLLKSNWFFYSNIEKILDCLTILEILVITISFIGTQIGHLGLDWYNKRSRPYHNDSGNSC